MAGLYLHIPFCSQRCSYCDFYFVTTRSSHTSFVEALCVEIEHYAATYAAQEPVETIYFGGGTPSLLTIDEVQRILDTIDAHFDTSNVLETTFELNPEDVDHTYLVQLRGLGVDRLSIGIQSFFADDLAFMNRSHTPEEAAAIVPMARAAGFENLSVDLIFGLPDQPLEYWGANLQRAIQLEVPHLSTYGLTVEERTPLARQVARGLVRPPDEEVMRERYQLTLDVLRGAGYEAYEISSFARPGFRAVHNRRYWEHANYLGFGPSAHSFWWKGLPARRWSNIRNLRRYEALIAQRLQPLDLNEHLDLDDLADEYLMLRLRTSEGLDLDAYENRYGVDLLVSRVEELARLEASGLIEPVRTHVRLTDAGRHLCDHITARLLADPD
ncbi:coproporphyrinogen III oxidase [Rhodothermaceae bacterium RA]|nr:coproporphyrinogen III oxidase [Rhodothermaceae bacterium RA]